MSLTFIVRRSSAIQASCCAPVTGCVDQGRSVPGFNRKPRIYPVPQLLPEFGVVQSVALRHTVDSLERRRNPSSLLLDLLNLAHRLHSPRLAAAIRAGVQ